MTELLDARVHFSGLLRGVDVNGPRKRGPQRRELIGGNRAKTVRRNTGLKPMLHGGFLRRVDQLQKRVDVRMDEPALMLTRRLADPAMCVEHGQKREADTARRCGS